MSERSELTKRLIAEGLPKGDPTLRQRLHDAALHVLRTGAPGLSDISRSALASAIALRCERAVHEHERAA